MIKRIIASLWLLALCSPALAQNVNLNCYNPSGSGLTQWVPCSATVPLPVSTSSSAAIAPQATQSAASNAVFKASAGSLYALDITIGATSGWVMVFDATSLPSNGATGATLKYCWPVISNGTVGGMSRSWAVPLSFASGITIGFSSTACNSLTASATAFFYGQVQ